jgi:hypothetical protein
MLCRNPNNVTVGTLAVVAAVGDSDRRPYYPDDSGEVALMDDRYVILYMVIGHQYFASSNTSQHHAVAWPFLVSCYRIRKLMNHCSHHVASITNLLLQKTYRWTSKHVSSTIGG